MCCTLLQSSRYQNFGITFQFHLKEPMLVRINRLCGSLTKTIKGEEIEDEEIKKKKVHDIYVVLTLLRPNEDRWQCLDVGTGPHLDPCRRTN